MWRRKIGKIFDLAGSFEEPPTPHRFRHTFARILLQRGVPVADVADLLGDDEKTVREHYSRWVPERQARLTKSRTHEPDDAERLEKATMQSRVPLRKDAQAAVFPTRLKTKFAAELRVHTPTRLTALTLTIGCGRGLHCSGTAAQIGWQSRPKTR
jgi:hypothetical protein